MISISLPKLIRFFCLVVLGLFCANFGVQFAKYFLGRGGMYGIYDLFSLDHEGNTPTWYSSVALLLCSLLLALIASLKQQQRDRYTNQWQGLAVLFLFLSIDESASIHEMLIHLVKPFAQTDNLAGLWLIPGSIFAIAIALVYWRFLTHLPARTRYLVLLSGAVYLSGAIVAEAAGASILKIYASDIPFEQISGWPGMLYQMLVAVEELLEMTGIVLFLYALLSYLNSEFEKVQFTFNKR